MIKRLALLALLLGGCDLYWGGGGGGDDVCNKAYEAVPEQQLRDPSTGQCQSFGWGGGNCGPCEPCPSGGAGAADPNWGQCYGACDALTETDCLASTSCHAAYFDNPPEAGGHQFWGCWDLPPYTATQTTDCASLDAQACSASTTCISNYNTATQTVGNTKFLDCAPEPGTASCATVDCGPGSHCEDQCYPCDGTNPNGCMDACGPVCIPDTTCANVDCGPGYTCTETCTGSVNGQPGSCSPSCVPTNTTAGECTGTITCATPPPACPSGTTAGRANGCYTGYCIPNAECAADDPGSCYGPVTCITGEPTCPSGTVAGLKNGCWTGYCIPQASCGQAPCEDLTTEASCQARMDCIPVYNGMNCTCYPDHCDCESETYARCETAVQPI